MTPSSAPVSTGTVRAETVLHPPVGREQQQQQQQQKAPAPGASAHLRPFTGLFVWNAAGCVICALCDAVKVQQSALRRHLLSPTQKAALAAASDGAGVLVAPLARAAVATATEDECKAVLGTALTPAQEGTLSRYDGATPWPSTPDARHVEAVPCLSLRLDTVACFSCRTASRSAAELGKVHEAGEPPRCTNRRKLSVRRKRCSRTKRLGFSLLRLCAPRL